MKTEDRLGLAASALAIAGIMYLATCTANAATVELRFRHPGGARAYAAVDVCRTSGCVPYPVPCDPGATCAVSATLESGVHPEVWIVAVAGAQRSPASNRIAVTAPAPSGCAWDLDASGSVAGMDFLAFMGRYRRGEANGVDFAAFREAFGAACS